MWALRENQHWQQTAEFVRTHLRDGEHIFAPPDFSEEFLGITTARSSVTPDDVARLDWAVVHKGRTASLSSELFDRVAAALPLVYANPVFLVFSRRAGLQKLNFPSPHLRFVGERLRPTPRPFLGRMAKAVRTYFARLLTRILAVTTRSSAGSETPVARPLLYVGDHTALTVTVWGHKMYLDTRDSSITPHLLLDGFWERGITRAFMGAVKKGMTVVEVGCNIGYYTLIAGSKVGPYGRVFGFEANPEAFSFLFRNVTINGFLPCVTLVNKAVLHTSGRTRLHRAKKFMGCSSVFEFSAQLTRRFDVDVETIEVESVSLDDYFSTRHTRVDLVKIDAEGSEPAIFRGMRRLLQGNPQVTVICEFSPHLLWRGGVDPQDFLREVKELGFVLRMIQEDSRITDTNEEELLTKDWCDLFLRR